jgi:DNA-binding CsgD family transcriptional regulator
LPNAFCRVIEVDASFYEFPVDLASYLLSVGLHLFQRLAPFGFNDLGPFVQRDIGRLSLTALRNCEERVPANAGRDAIVFVETLVLRLGRGRAPEMPIDFLTKPVSDADLLAAITRAEKDDASTRHLNAELDSINARFAILTPREREVMTHVIAGRLNKQIAGDLGTVEKTIKVHRGRVMEKMGVRSVADLVRLAEKAGISAQNKS